MGDKMSKHNIKSTINFFRKVIKRRKKYLGIYFLGFMMGVIFILSITDIFIFSKKYLINNPSQIITLIIISIIINLIVFILFLKYQKIVDLNDTLEDLKKERTIKESLFHLNHEIKNPLAVVNGYLEMIDKTNIKEKKDKYLEIIREEIKRSIKIINDYSSLGRIDKLEKEPMDLSLIFEDIIYILSPLTKRSNGLINYENIEDELYINGDYDRLKQVFINLIKNSIESKDKDYIIINVRIKKLKKSYKISITDNGEGMNSDVLNHLEDVFYSTKQNGTGIGLAYVKKILELHKGRITFKSKEREGTTVTVTLPSLN